jgi:chromosome segregation ATPase
MGDDETIVFTLAEFSSFQNEMLKLKHENTKLKKQTDQFLELTQMHSDPLEYVENLKEQVQVLTTELQRDRGRLSFNRAKALEKVKQAKGEVTQADLDFLSTISEAFEEVRSTEKPDTELNKLRAELRKAALTSESLGEKCKVLETALDSTSTSLSERTKQLEELESQKENLIYLLASREEEINEARAQIKDKYSMECEKFELQTSYDQLLVKTRRLEEEINSLRGEGALTVKEKLAELEGENEGLKKELSQSKDSLTATSLELDSLKTSATADSSELRTTKAELTQAREELQTLQSRVKKLQTELDDARTEKQIVQKRSMHDLKDLKQELAKEKAITSESKVEVERMRNEIRQLQALQRTTVRAKLDAAGTSEKVFVEELSNRVNELEMELMRSRKKTEAADLIQAELDKQTRLNEELLDEIAGLQIDLATYGAQVNDLIRRGALK